MDVEEHYKKHLGDFYTWMLGDWASKKDEFRLFLKEHSILPGGSQVAVDLGAGNGIQTIALEELGYQVLAIDFNPQLLEELRTNISNDKTRIVEGDIRNFSKHLDKKVNLILCCGDTIAHLDSLAEIEVLLKDIHQHLEENGYIILSFRDYSLALESDSRFIPVKSDENQIHTCILDYETDKVRVTDLLYKKNGATWDMKISSYYKVRIRIEEILSLLLGLGFEVLVEKTFQRMTTMIGKRK
ncbi:class I SAM-dependent methyltransferase [Leptospira ognonensis]|uniref:Class I SAM-dependent methyltransferase n=1 Tax=Leptospira ognonensis TaxID=2484945 RepID=A0A4R9K346_9LEPT|nr:class I SAM-dependent methyltransferase [Leptospira ognonensis]TGL59310.1 class I SAM-dependent methyltransferase [Leptospira ognonensis]